MTLLYILLIALAMVIPTAVILGLRYFLLQRHSQNETRSLKKELDAFRKNAGRQAQLEKTQYDKNDMLVQAMRHSPLYVFVKEVTETTSRMLASSENYKQLPGRSGAGVTGRIMEELFPADFAAQTVAKDRAALASNTVQTVEEELDGHHYITTKFPIVSGGRRLLAGFTIDITERKQAEAERELLMRAVEAAFESIVITDTSGTILYVNPAFSAVTGYTREEALNQNPRILQSGIHNKEFFANMWSTIGSGHTWSGQLVNKRKDGVLYTEQATISPIFDSAGKLVSFVAVKRDITEQLRIAQENALLQEQLAQAQKMESIGRLAGGIAHDFNNMLQAIMGYADMALMQECENSSVTTDIQEIKKAAQQAAALTRQLQTFARRDVTRPTTIDINNTIQELLTMLRRLIGSDIKLAWHPHANAALIKLDAAQFNQIVMNMIINARDALGADGVITLATSPVNVTDGSHHDLTAGAYVCFSVHDNGSGIDSDIVARIFDPFFTTKPVGQGTGLGLSVVYGIVKQAGGTIYVTSEKNKGTLFEIMLPRATVATEQQEEPHDGENPATASGETILLVDDEAAVLKMTQRLLENAGYKVLPSTDSQKALEIFAANIDQVELVISDVVMPDLSGPEMIKRMLAMRPQLKYFFISGHTANLLENVGLPDTQANCIQKPFSARDLMLKVNSRLNTEL